MIEKVANNKYNTEKLNLNPTDKVKEKLDYYRTLFNRIQDLTDDEFESLKQNIKTFFNLKLYDYTEESPDRLIRISINNRILKAQNKELSYLTDISQLLAPPIEFCNYGRCNITNQQILYCATSEALAYWETKPKNGDVITLSHFKLKPGAKLKTNVVRSKKTKDPEITNQLQEIYYLLEDFFVDAYSLEIDRDRPRDYLFSALLSSEMLFYPVVSDRNIEAIMYPSVQKKKFGINMAIRNDVMFEKYDLIAVETRFILDEYENLDPSTEDLTTDQVIGSFYTTEFDFINRKIIYNEKADQIFEIFRKIQVGPGKQERIDNGPDVPKNIAFNLTPTLKSKSFSKSKYQRNDKLSVVYQNGEHLDNIKFKNIEKDLNVGKCRIVKY